MEITDLDQTTIPATDEATVKMFLASKIDGRNAFWLTKSEGLDRAGLSEPLMIILTKGEIAYVWYVGSSENAGFCAIAHGANADNYDDDVDEDFDISEFDGDRVTIRSKFVLPSSVAADLGWHFIRTSQMSDDVRWFEL
jgi:hypothetical protein